MTSGPSPEPHSRLHPALRLLPGLRGQVGALQVARSVYGAIIGLSLLIVLQQGGQGPGGSAVALLATLSAVALAEAYADTLAHTITVHHPMTPAAISELLGGAIAIIGAGVPAALVLAFVPAWLGDDAAFTVAAWLTVALLGLFAFGARRLGGDQFGRSLRTGLVAAGIGALIAVLKAVLH